MTEIYDLAIIGGGINGCGAAADAAMRGLSVILFEQDDIASKTSSSSTKLIHGGLRYLEYYDFALVKRSLEERQRLLDLAPHLVKPLEIVLPLKKKLRPSWMLRVGLFLYDHLSSKNRLPKSRLLRKKSQARYFSGLKDSFQKAFSFYDGFTDDARLTLANALQAARHGATIYTQSKLIQAEVNDKLWYLTIKQGPITRQIIARSLINAAGPWMEPVSKLLHIPQLLAMSLVKGSHILVPKLYEGNQAYLLQQTDKRIVFVIPYFGLSMIGTTDSPFHGSLDKVEIDDAEIKYLCAAANSYFKKTIVAQQIIFSWSGIRPLIFEKDKSAQALSRDYSIHFSTAPAPAVTVYSGKITTYRKLAADAVDQLTAVFPKLPKSNSQNIPLPGAFFGDMDFISYQSYIQKQHPWLPESLRTRYLNQYGTLAETFLQNCQSLDNLGPHFGHGLYQAEVDYLMKEEWAKTAEDILWRRSKLGLVFESAEIEALEKYMGNIVN